MTGFTESVVEDAALAWPRFNNLAHPTVPVHHHPGFQTPSHPMRLPDAYSAIYAEELLSAIATSADTTYRKAVVDALRVSAADPAKALLWSGVIRRACGAGRIPAEIADYLVMHCASAAARTLMAADDERLDEEIEEINRSAVQTPEATSPSCRPRLRRNGTRALNRSRSAAGRAHTKSRSRCSANGGRTGSRAGSPPTSTSCAIRISAAPRCSTASRARTRR